MIRVLIAEDEIPLLRGIKIMIEKINPEFNVVKCVYNGKEAIEYLKENSVDVIFTDINMPLVDGIKLMEYVSSNSLEVDMVVISGYNDFKYAQQAIHYNAKEYLLKPIIKEDLALILDKIQNLYNERKTKRQKDILKDAVYESNKAKGEEKIQIAYLCAGPMVKEGMEESVVECRFWKDIQIDKVSTKLLPTDTTVYSFERNKANEKIILIVSKEKVDLKDFCMNFVKEMQEQKITVNCAYYDEVIQTKQIPIVSYQLRKILLDNMVIGECGIFSNNYIDNNSNKEIIKRFCLSIPNTSIEKEEILLKEAQEIFENNHIKQKECVYILQILFKNLMESNENIDTYIDEMVWNLILDFQNTQHLFSTISQILDKNGKFKKQQTTEELMKKLDTYVMEHITEPISSASLAIKFGLVAPYLSKLFKEYSGYTVSQYIQKLRLDRAKKLLEMDENILAKDVAEMVGYPNPLYFSKIFKKKVGVYPSEYRKKLCEKINNVEGENDK